MTRVKRDSSALTLYHPMWIKKSLKFITERLKFNSNKFIAIFLLDLWITGVLNWKDLDLDFKSLDLRFELVDVGFI